MLHFVVAFMGSAVDRSPVHNFSLSKNRSHSGKYLTQKDFGGA